MLQMLDMVNQVWDWGRQIPWFKIFKVGNEVLLFAGTALKVIDYIRKKKNLTTSCRDCCSKKSTTQIGNPEGVESQEQNSVSEADNPGLNDRS